MKTTSKYCVNPIYTEIIKKFQLDDIFWKNLKYEKVPDRRFGSELVKFRKITTFIIIFEFYKNRLKIGANPVCAEISQKVPLDDIF